VQSIDEIRQMQAGAGVEISDDPEHPFLCPNRALQDEK